MKLSFFTNRQYREEKVLNWISVGLLFFITAFIWVPKRDGLQAIFALGFLLPLLCVLPFRKPEFKNYGGWMTYLALIFTAYSVLTSLWAPENKVDFFLIQWIVLAVWLMGINWLAHSREINWNKIQELLLLMGALIGLINILIFYGQYPINGRLEGFFMARNPNEVGALFGVLTLLAFCQWLNASDTRKIFHYSLLWVMLSVPLLLSQSRGSMLALIITGLMAIFYIRPSPKKIYILMGLIVSGLVMLVLNWQLLTDDRIAIGFRDVIWQEVFSRSVHEHFWFGLGMEKFEKIIIPDVDVFDHAHNVWLDTFYHTGLVGLILGLLHVFYVLQKFKPSSAQIALYLWLMFSLIAAMFDYRTFFWQIDFKWFLFWIPVGLISAIQLQEKRFAQDQIADKKDVGVEKSDGC